MRLPFTILALAIFCIAADDANETAKADLKKMGGAWTATNYTVEGKPLPTDELKQIKLVIKGNKSTFTRKGVSGDGTYKLDASKKPPYLDIAVTTGPDKGKTMLAIYQLQGDTMKICLATEGKTRPKSFEAKAGTILEEWKREGAPKAQVAAKKTAPMEEKKAAPPAPPKKPAPPPFVDKALEAAVRDTLKEPTGELNEEKLGNVHVLEAPGKNIKDLRGLDKCRNLALLNLARNQVEDVSALKDLSVLQSLDLSHNQIKDVTPLGGLNKLQYLEISHNQISRVDALSGLSSLTSIYAGNNQITDIAPLGKLSKLWTLSVGGNRIQNIGAVASLPRLSTVDLSGNQITDLGPITKLGEVSLLILEKNKITDLTPLVNLVQADAKGEKRVGPYLRLYLKDNPLQEKARSGQMTALKTLGVRIESQ